ncbi:hypothetical protein COLO4_12383 [Corchorus olitorius]|uniref:Uncharacterized protein n=1 Tax=Corchorus olitorius TaxID=93759 RepID=A0A1R3K123_9ROSI|nr:hypothetical protein COLO4_12383 [Corchorus olitorius]
MMNELDMNMLLQYNRFYFTFQFELAKGVRTAAQDIQMGEGEQPPPPLSFRDAIMGSRDRSNHDEFQSPKSRVDRVSQADERTTSIVEDIGSPVCKERKTGQ